MRHRNPHPPGLTAYEIVDGQLYCVLTRIRLRHFWLLPAVWWRFRQVQRQAQQIPQLKRSVLLLEGFDTIFTLSIWEGEEGYLQFGTNTTEHVKAIRETYPGIVQSAGKWEVWSTEWKIRAISRNLNWGALNEWSNGAGAPPQTPIDATSE